MADYMTILFTQKQLSIIGYVPNLLFENKIWCGWDVPETINMATRYSEVHDIVLGEVVFIETNNAKNGLSLKIISEIISWKKTIDSSIGCVIFNSEIKSKS